MHEIKAMYIEPRMGTSLSTRLTSPQAVSRIDQSSNEFKLFLN